MTRKTIVRTAISVCAVLAAGAVVFLLWWKGFFLPGWITWENKEAALASESEDGGRTYRLVLKHRQFVMEEIPSGLSVLLRTQGDWYVSDFLTGDIDRDGAPEVLLLVWKHGSYGKHRPFWVEHDTIQFSQHIFIYKLQNNILRPIWMSSALELCILEWELDDQAMLTIKDLDGKTSKWAWIWWGLTRVD